MKYNLILLALLLIGSNVSASEFGAAKPDILLNHINLNKNIKECKNQKTYNEIQALLSVKEEPKFERAKSESQILHEETMERVKKLGFTDITRGNNKIRGGKRKKKL
jgi:hypothetical protein